MKNFDPATELAQFIEWLAGLSFQHPDELFRDSGIGLAALRATALDVRYHYPEVSDQDVLLRVVSDANELAVFLYRFSRLVYERDQASSSLRLLRALMKRLCSCEIYCSTSIGEGLQVVHGEGTVIGSRNVIGRGLTIYQGATIGHLKIGGSGMRIGDDVRIFAGAKVLGELLIADRTTVGANAVLTRNTAEGEVVFGPRS